MPFARASLTVGVAAAAVLGAAGAARSAPSKLSESAPYPGVHHELWRDAAVPVRLHVVRVDLSSAELTVFATAEGDRGARTSAYAQAKSAQIAINGDTFRPAGYATLGLAVGDGVAWSQTADDGTSGFLRFARVGERTDAAIVVPELVIATDALPAGTEGVISGRPLLVRAGQPASSFDCTDEVAIPCVRAPRTAVALSADGNTMWLVVVDGWQEASLGMTATELATFLDGLGARDALGLDIGGASTLYVANQGGVVSSPSDGVERVVANHLAIRYGALTPGQLVGFVRERDIFDASANLAGVLVTLDDGRSDTTATDGLYNFPGVSPRYACVTAEKAGYRTETACKQVQSGQVNYNSIAMYPLSDFPDAGPGEPDATPADAATALDGGGGGADGGDGIGGDDDGDGGGGCCRVEAGGAPAGPILVTAILALRLRRRSREGDRARRGNER